ncbi:MAG: hypothetical protein [Chaetfec virus UA24_144]|nr:MAG: hypothetical protein [Chaetfec virus UA24_144]
MFSSGPSLADIAAVTGNNGGRNGGNGWGDGNGWWVLIILFALFGGWGRGWGGQGGGDQGGGSSQGALTRGDLCMDMNFNDLESAVRSGVAESNANFRTVDNAVCSLGYNNAQLANGIQQSIASGFAGVDNAICNQSFQLERGITGLGQQISQCCCDTRAELAQNRFQAAQDSCALQNTIQTSTRDIIDNQNAGTRAILDQINANYVRQLESENQGLRLAASQEAQNQYLVNQLRPCPTPAYITCNPWANQAAYGSCGCSC